MSMYEVANHLWRYNRDPAPEGVDTPACELKSLLFMLALFRSIIRGKDQFPEVLVATLLGSVTLLAAPFAWGKSMVAAAEGCDYLKADAREVMSFVAMLQFHDPQIFVPELVEVMQGVSSDLRCTAVKWRVAWSKSLMNRQWSQIWSIGDIIWYKKH